MVGTGCGLVKFTSELQVCTCKFTSVGMFGLVNYNIIQLGGGTVWFFTVVGTWWGLVKFKSEVQVFTCKFTSACVHL